MDPRGLTGEVHVRPGVHLLLGEGLLEELAGGGQHGAVGREGAALRPQRDVTEQPRLPLAPQPPQDLGAVRRHRLGYTAPATLWRERGREREREREREKKRDSQTERGEVLIIPLFVMFIFSTIVP